MKNPPLPGAQPCNSSDPDQLAKAITELAAHIHAATFQLLEMIREFDRQEGWAGHGIQSCAHWLNWQCGMNLGAAREKVRVAHALAELPQISATFREGRVSYSKVRAMTRVATPENEDYLLYISRHGTAAHVERLVSQYRRHQRSEALELDNNRHAHRELSWHCDEEGMWVFRGRFTPEQGALISKALELGMNELFEEQRNEPPDVAAEMPAGVSACNAQPHPVALRRADALERMATCYLAGTVRGASGGDQYLVHINTTVDTLTMDGAGAESELEDNGRVSAETSRRIACDASVVRWTDNAEGESLSVGRKTRSIPPAIRRALQRRDGGCRFPGCTCTRFVDAHHVRHWADGGETSMSNLVLLCRRHHRLMHEGGFAVCAAENGEVKFSYPDGKPLPAAPDGRFRGNADTIRATNRKNKLNITHRTPIPLWHGERLDHDLALLGMISLE